MSIDIPEDIIIPPPAIKEIILKTATYVDKNGKSFEEKILSSSSSQFSFINDSDDYHSYYLYVLENITEFNKEENGTDEVVNAVTVEKPADLEFVIESLPSITLKDLKIIRLTAHFIAKNGEDRINLIKGKYSDQVGQFDFLNPDHSFHKLFLKYLKQYKIILNDEVLEFGTDLIESAFARAEYNELDKQNEISAKEIESLKRQKYSAINWQDFVIVETIEFNEIDKITEFPEPFTKEDLQFRSLETKSKQVSEYKPVKNVNNGINIREFGATRLKKNETKQKLIECPITGRLIPEANFEKHIQILLRDPKYKIEKENYESKIKNSNLSTSEVVTNIKNLFNKPNSNKRQKVQWDGYKSSVDFVKSANSATSDEQEEFKRKQDQQRNSYGPQIPNQ